MHQSLLPVLSLFAFLALSRPAPAQTEDNPWTDMELLERRIRSGNTRLAEDAVRRIEDRAMAWSDADLARLKAAAEGADVEAADRIGRALKEVSERRRRIEGLSTKARRFALVALGLPGKSSRAMRAAREMRRFGEISAADLEGLEKFLPPIPSGRDFWDPGAPLPKVVWTRAMSDRSASELGSHDEERLRKAIWELGENGASEHAPEVLALLRDERAWVRYQAAVALDLMGEPVPVDPLLEVVSRLPDGAAAELVVLASRHDPEAVAQSSWVASDSGMPLRRGAALLALSRSRSPAVRPRLIAGLRSSATFVALTARDSLLALDPAETAPVLVPSFTDTRPRARELAAWLAGDLGVGGSEDELRKLLKNIFPRVRAEAARALGKLCRDGDASVVADCIGDADPLVRLAAVEALASWGASADQGCLVALLDDEDSEVRLAAAEVLSVAADPAMRSLIREQVRGRKGHSLPWTALALLGDPVDIRFLTGDEQNFAAGWTEWGAAEALALAPTEEACAALTGIVGFEMSDSEATLLFARLGRREQAWITGTGGPHALRTSGRMALSMLVAPSGFDPLARVVEEGLPLLPAGSPRLERARRAAGLVRAGFGGRREVRRLLREVEAARDELALWGAFHWDFSDSYIAQVTEVALEAFASRYEAATVEAWMRPLTLKADVRDTESLVAAFSDAGLKLGGAKRAKFRGRIPAGLVVTPRWLAWRVGLEACVLEAGTARAVPVAFALAWWRDRLDRER